MSHNTGCPIGCIKQHTMEETIRETALYRREAEMKNKDLLIELHSKSERIKVLEDLVKLGLEHCGHGEYGVGESDCEFCSGAIEALKNTEDSNNDQ